MKKTLTALALFAALAMPCMAQAAEHDSPAPFWAQVGQALKNVASAPIDFAKGIKVDSRTAGSAAKVEATAKAAAKKTVEAAKRLKIEQPSPAWPK